MNHPEYNMIKHQYEIFDKFVNKAQIKLREDNKKTQKILQKRQAIVQLQESLDFIHELNQQNQLINHEYLSLEKNLLKVQIESPQKNNYIEKSHRDIGVQTDGGFVEPFCKVEQISLGDNFSLQDQINQLQREILQQKEKTNQAKEKYVSQLNLQDEVRRQQEIYQVLLIEQDQKQKQGQELKLKQMQNKRDLQRQTTQANNLENENQIMEEKNQQLRDLIEMTIEQIKLRNSNRKEEISQQVQKLLDIELNSQKVQNSE